MLNQLFLCHLDCEKFNAQNGRFVAQSEDLTLKLEIYRSK